MSGAVDSVAIANPPPVTVAAASEPQRLGFFMRLFGSAVLGQAMLSAASFAVGLLLIRHASDAQYGSYVLVISGILLLTSLQNAFFGPSIVIRIAPLDREGRGQVMGSLYAAQQKVVLPLVLGLNTLALLLWLGGAIGTRVAMLMLAACCAGAAAMRREYFRMSMLANRHSPEVLRADFVYVVLLVAGAGAALLTPIPAVMACITLALAAVVGGNVLFRDLKQLQSWHPQSQPGLLRQIAPGALWTAGGAATHWIFSQGYTYVVALALDVQAVAAIAATRLLLMPVVLMSTGVGSMMLPTTAGWLNEHSAATVFRRALLFCALLVAGAGLYLGIMWAGRDWLFAELLRKNFADRDALLLLWSLIAVLIVMRDQLLYLPLARGRFRQLTLASMIGAAVSLACTWWGMQHYGVIGALLGMLAGEFANLLGILWLSLRELRVPQPPLVETI